MFTIIVVAAFAVIAIGIGAITRHGKRKRPTRDDFAAALLAELEADARDRLTY